MKGQKREFTPEEVEYIVNNWGKESAHSMKKKFNCSWNAVCRVAEENGLELPKSNNWTKEEVQTLKDLCSRFKSKKTWHNLNKRPKRVDKRRRTNLK